MSNPSSRIDAAAAEAFMQKLMDYMVDDTEPEEMLNWILECYEPRTQGQRCDGSGRLRYAQMPTFGVDCPGCPNCSRQGRLASEAEIAERTGVERVATTIMPPKATPPSVSEVMTGSEGERNAYVAGYTANILGVQLIAPNPVLSGGEVVPLLVELGPSTLRALMVAIVSTHPQMDGDAANTVRFTDALLTALDKEPKP